MEVKEIYPYIDDAGNVRDGLCKHIVIDSETKQPLNYTVIQEETGAEYFEPIDIYPCPYTYIVGNEIVEETEENEIE